MSRLSIFVFALIFSLCYTYGIIAFDPSTVDPATKQTWCTDQMAVCTNSCQDSGSNNATVNTCNATTLDYSCVCSDGKSPSPSNYTLTIPYFECISDVTTCTNNCSANDANCVKGCQKQCAANVTTTKSIAPVTSTSTSTSANPTSSVFNPYGAASLSAPSINVCFAALLTALFVSFACF